jgi:hypothetical protein
MGDVQTMRDRPKEKLRGRDRRSLNLSTKLTAVEARVIEDAATRAGKTPSEWAREALLKAASGGFTTMGPESGTEFEHIIDLEPTICGYFPSGRSI